MFSFLREIISVFFFLFKTKNTMIPPAETLLKYDNPVLITSTKSKSPKRRHLRMSFQLSDNPAPTPPSTPKSASGQELENEDVLHTILPPREWTEGNETWVQKVSSTPCTRTDVVRLEELLNTKLQQRQARETGICPVRRELYSQCFDELIRHVTIMCAERGLLLLRVRNEINMTLAAYQVLYESSIAFGMRKALQAEKEKNDQEKKIADLENEIQDLTQQLNKQKAKCDALEKREAEKRRVEEKNFLEKIQSLKKTNEQLQNQLEGTFAPKK